MIDSNRLYSFISQMNQSIIRACSEFGLYDDACRIAHELGMFEVAWIGRIDSAARRIDIVAQCGMQPSDQKLFTNVTYINGGPQHHVVTTLQCYVCDDIENDVNLELWKPFARNRGWRSCIVCPIILNGSVIATFNLCSSQTNFFGEEVISLLTDMATNISFALDILERKKVQEAALEQLRHSEFRLKQSQSLAHFGSWELNFARGVATWSEEACRIYGLPIDKNTYTYEEWIAFIHPEDLPYVQRLIKEFEETRSPADFYHRIKRRDGSVRYLHSLSYFEFDASGVPTGLCGVAQDITEQSKNIIQLQHQNEHLRKIAWVQSHQIRGPLATVLGFAQLLSYNLPDVQIEDVVKGLLSSATQLDNAIREIVRNATEGQQTDDQS